MAKIVGVHGIANTFCSSAKLSDEWFYALHGGLQEANGPELNRGDLTVTAYGALFQLDAEGNERIPTRGVIGVPQSFAFEDDWEYKLIEDWWRAAAKLSAENRKQKKPDELGEDSGIQSPDFHGRTRTRTPQIAQRGLLQLAKSRFFREFAPQVLILALRQVRLFLHEPKFKQAILDRLAENIKPDTRVVIGHSLGSVVAYEGLCTHPEWKIDTFVTLGSPLGIPNVVFDALSPQPENGKARWPNVKRWVNIADKGDLVALVKTLAPQFGPVEDVLVHNGWKSHDVTHYLVHAETGKAVVPALQRSG